MKQCPTCARTFDAPSAVFCPADGAPLVDAARPQDSLVGVTIDGKYRIEELLGAGGMGSVYRARHLLLDRFVAVKTMKSDLLKDPLMAERFKREAQASARLAHPNAVTVYDFGISADGSAYLVMELLKGTSLRDLLKRDRVLTYARAVEIFGKVASAIDSAHEQGIIHRDLKPDNVMVDERPNGSVEVKVVDFGIAKFKGPTPDTAHLTGTGMIVGTVNYMSPEQCRGHAIDARSDIYSIGIMLYEALTGRTPFESHTPSAVIIDHVNTPPPPPRQFRTDLPPAVERVILDALAKNPADRPHSATELAQRLAVAIPKGDAATAAVTVPLQTAPAMPAPYSTGGGAQATSAASGPAGAFATPDGQHPAYAFGAAQDSLGGARPPVPAKRGVSPLAVVAVVLLLLVVGGVAVVAIGIFGLAALTEDEPVANRTNPPPPSTNAGGTTTDKPPATNSTPWNTNNAPTNENTSPDDTVVVPPTTNEDTYPGGDNGDTSGTPRQMTEAEMTEVGAAMALWLYAIMSKNLDMTVGHFADQVDYFSAGVVPKSRVRASYERAFAKYDQLEFEIEQFHEATANPDDTFQVVFDKSWNFTGDEDSSGRVKELLVFKRVGGQLKIVKIEDLEHY